MTLSEPQGRMRTIVRTAKQAARLGWRGYKERPLVPHPPGAHSSYLTQGSTSPTKIGDPMTGQHYPIFTAEMQQPCNSSSQMSASDGYNISNQTQVSDEYDDQASARDGYNSSGGITGPQDRELVLFIPIERYFGRAPILIPPSNHIDCETPHANPHLRLEEPLFFRTWSRDISRGPNEAEGMLDIYATTASSDIGGNISSFPDYERSYNLDASGSEDWLLADSNGQQINFQPDFPEHPEFYSADGQWYL